MSETRTVVAECWTCRMEETLTALRQAFVEVKRELRLARRGGNENDVRVCIARVDNVRTRLTRAESAARWKGFPLSHHQAAGHDVREVTHG